jgi:hypothetical protein
MPVIVMLAGLLGGCGGGSGVAPAVAGIGASVDIRDIKTGVVSASNVVNKRYEVVKSQAVFEMLYQMVYLSSVPSSGEQAPMIDFETRNVAAILLGTKPTGGYSVKVTKIVESGGYITINIETTIPGSHCSAIDAITQPFSFISYPKSNKEVLFNESVVVTHCDDTVDAPLALEYRTLETNETAVGINETKKFEVIRDSTRFAEVYGSNSVNPLPDVDFTKEIVVALLAGVHPTAGYAIAASKVEAYARHIVVDVVSTAPGESCAVDGVLTAPRSFVVVPERSKEIAFHEIGETMGCGN